MRSFFCDMHIHIGRAGNGKVIKIPSSSNLIFENIIRESYERKGLDLIGIVDCASPYVIEDIKKLIDKGDLIPCDDGGYLYKNKMGVILGSEIGTTEKDKKCSHQLCYFPFLKDLISFGSEMKKHITNINLSSQKARITATHLFDIVKEHFGIVIPAHVFTPHNGMYGSCVSTIKDIFRPDQIKTIFAVELGLSADSYIADHLKELQHIEYLSNSDSHSLDKIAREYNEIIMENTSFSEWVKGLKKEDGRKIIKNFGLDPRLGKYHRNYCKKCESIVVNFDESVCNNCGGQKIIVGVLDRVRQISGKTAPFLYKDRPPYNYQIPLLFIPGLGKKGYENLLNYFGNEMNVLNHAKKYELEEVVGVKLAKLIFDGIHGKLAIKDGGGGKYGKII